MEILQAASRDHIPVDPKSRRFETDTQCGPSSINSIPDSQNRPSICQVLREITGRQSEDYENEDLNEFIGLEWYKGQIIYRKTFQPLQARTGDCFIFFIPRTSDLCNIIAGSLNSPLSLTISHALKAARNISFFYTHQAAAINAIQGGQNVVVSTSTASGKSIIYQVRPSIFMLRAGMCYINFFA